MASFLDREHSVAGPGYNRWLVPPAALAIHLSIGQVYAFSVFKNPLVALHGVDGATWNFKEVGYIFSIAIAVLGLSAAIFGQWLERAGPRKVMFVAALCFGSGFFIAAGGAALHSLALIYLGYGIVGGIGLGLGYIAPVATLVKWFPDRPGLATGLAIMGFGGGAMIGSPLGTELMSFFQSTGKAPLPFAWMTMGVLYFLFMLFGVFMVRIPPANWKPEGWEPRPGRSGLISTHDVTTSNAMRTPQFWLLWFVLCLNVTAGIGILEQASPMIQELFSGHVTPAAAAGFVGVLSLFNMAGRFFWSATSDLIGRKLTFLLFFALGVPLYWLLPYTAASGTDSVLLFVLIAGVLLSMYGGGFSTMPAYLKDLFGSKDFGAIYGRVLTAWSTAGILGPLLVNGILDHYVGGHLPRQQAYPLILHIMSGLLVLGFVCNLLVHPVAERFWIQEQQAPEIRRKAA